MEQPKMLNALLVKIKLFITLEECKMVDGYVLLITNGISNISRVPTKHKDAVTYKLAVLGVDGQNNQISDEARQEIIDAYENAA